MRMPKSMNPVNFLEEPGIYLLAILEIEEDPTNKSGEYIDAIRVKTEVLAGTSKQVGAKFSPLIWNPSEDHNDQGEFCTMVQCRLARAADCLPDAQPGEEIEIEWQQAIGKKVIVKAKEDGDFLGIDGAHIYHVDDKDDVPNKCPRVKGEVKSTTKGSAAKGNQRRRRRPASQPKETPAPSSYNDI